MVRKLLLGLECFSTRWQQLAKGWSFRLSERCQGKLWITNPSFRSLLLPPSLDPGHLSYHVFNTILNACWLFPFLNRMIDYFRLLNARIGSSNTKLIQEMWRIPQAPESTRLQKDRRWCFTVRCSKNPAALSYQIFENHPTWFLILLANYLETVNFKS